MQLCSNWYIKRDERCADVFLEKYRTQKPHCYMFYGNMIWTAQVDMTWPLNAEMSWVYIKLSLVKPSFVKCHLAHKDFLCIGTFDISRSNHLVQQHLLLSYYNFTVISVMGHFKKPVLNHFVFCPQLVWFWWRPVVTVLCLYPRSSVRICSSASWTTSTLTCPSQWR